MPGDLSSLLRVDESMENCPPYRHAALPASSSHLDVVLGRICKRSLPQNFTGGQPGGGFGSTAMRRASFPGRFHWCRSAGLGMENDMSLCPARVAVRHNASRGMARGTLACVALQLRTNIDDDSRPIAIVRDHRRAV